MSSFLIEDWMLEGGLNLKGCELLLYALIWSYSRKGKQMYESEQSLAERFGYSQESNINCAALVPDCVWLATGGKGQLNDRVKVLAGRRIIAFPDVDGYEVWVKKAEDYKQRESSCQTCWKRTPHKKTVMLTSISPIFLSADARPSRVMSRRF